MTSINLQPYNLLRSEKVIWRFPNGVSSALEGIKSKSLRSFLTNLDSTLSQHQITIKQSVLNETEYLAWLPYYREKMQENGYETLANEEWFEKKTAENKVVEGIFLYQTDRLIGSGIITVESTEKAVFSFKATDRLELSGKSNSSLGSVVDYLFIKSMLERGMKIISGGRSRNAFGVINTLGYLDYKLKFGYTPTIDSSLPEVSEVPLNDEGIVVFLGHLQDDTTKQAFYALKPNGLSKNFEFTHYLDATLPFTLIEY